MKTVKELGTIVRTIIVFTLMYYGPIAYLFYVESVADMWRLEGSLMAVVIVFVSFFEVFFWRAKRDHLVVFRALYRIVLYGGTVLVSLALWKYADFSTVQGILTFVSGYLVVGLIVILRLYYEIPFFLYFTGQFRFELKAYGKRLRLIKVAGRPHELKPFRQLGVAMGQSVAVLLVFAFGQIFFEDYAMYHVDLSRVLPSAVGMVIVVSILSELITQRTRNEPSITFSIIVRLVVFTVPMLCGAVYGWQIHMGDFVGGSITGQSWFGVYFVSSLILVVILSLWEGDLWVMGEGFFKNIFPFRKDEEARSLQSLR